MKKLIVTLALMFGTMSTIAANVKYSDIYDVKDSTTVTSLTTAGIRANDVVELANAKIIPNTRILFTNQVIRSNEGYDEFILNAIKKLSDVHIMFYVTKNTTPKAYAYVTSQEMKQFVVSYLIKSSVVCEDVDAAYSIVVKFESFPTTTTLDAKSMIDLVNAKYITITGASNIRDVIARDAVKQIKIWYRKNGKSFVAKKDETTGKIVDPIEAPYNELINALNAPKMEGLNEWIDKYDVRWSHIDLSWLDSNNRIEELRTAILIDEQKLNTTNRIILDLMLGVKGLDAFIDEYNNGSSN